MLSGPGEHVFEEGISHFLQSKSSQKDCTCIWAEELQEDQIDIICGTYKVYNHSSRCISMTQDVSWFPKGASFKNSGLDVGFWSADAEHWYLRRVEMYHNGSAQGRCQNQMEWRRSIRLWNAATKTSQGLESFQSGLSKNMYSITELPRILSGLSVMLYILNWGHTFVHLFCALAICTISYTVYV